MSAVVDGCSKLLYECVIAVEQLLDSWQRMCSSLICGRRDLKGGD